MTHGLCQVWHYRRSSAATANVNGCARVHAVVFHKLFCYSTVLLCGKSKDLSCCIFNAHAHILCKRSPRRTSSFNRAVCIIPLRNKACKVCSASHGQTNAKSTIALNSCVLRISIHRTNSNQAWIHNFFCVGVYLVIQVSNVSRTRSHVNGLAIRNLHHRTATNTNGSHI